jgi:hypothetical protein
LKNLIIILNKVITREFYRTNAAFFLVAIGLCCGFMSGVEHKALAEFFISSPIVFLIPLLFWIGYALKVIQFNKKIFDANENEFLFSLQLIDKKIQSTVLLSVVVIQFLPVAVYAIFLMATAVKNAQYSMVGYILLSVLMLLIASTAMLLKQVNHPKTEAKESGLEKLLNEKFNRHNLEFFFEWIVRDHLMALIGSKFFTCIVLMGTLALYTTDIYDWRLMGMGITLAMTGNLALIYQYHIFQEQRLSILRNLPLSLLTRFANFTFTVLVICLPEFGILIKNFPLNLAPYELIATILFCIGILTTIYSCLYIKRASLDKMVTRCFIGVMTLILLILFKISLFIIAFLLIAGSVILFRKYYYVFEFITEEDINNAYTKSAN